MRQAPTWVSFGYFLISSRQPWSSTRCQWKVLSLWAAMASMTAFSVSSDWTWRALSTIRPRQAKRGASSIDAAGKATGPLAASGVASCHSDMAP